MIKFSKLAPEKLHQEQANLSILSISLVEQRA
jgi:hypothetical protein